MIESSTTISISVLDIVEGTTVDGPGFRTSIYAAGCDNRCPGCHNPQSWEIKNGRTIDIDALMQRIKADDLANVTFSGGDPLYQPEAFTQLAIRIKRETTKTIWCYTGYRFEQIAQSERHRTILPYIDVLVDGKFEVDKADDTLVFRGSRNQRIIDVKRSLQEQRIVELDRENEILI